ncbi:MAG: hypothetical protein EOR45_37405, partial [Mesorhizobium sp.]
MRIVVEIERGDFGLLRVFRQNVEGFPVIESPAPIFTAAGLFVILTATVTATLAAHAQQLEQEEVTDLSDPRGPQKVYLAIWRPTTMSMAAYIFSTLHPDGRLFLANVPGIENSGPLDSQIARLLNWALDHWGDRSFSET